MIALIPARAGSKRVPGKNMRVLAGHPLIAYTIVAAQECGLFQMVKVCSDDDAALELAESMGATTYARQAVRDDQCDIEWVRGAVTGSHAESFAILRPTSPFRTAETINRAFRQFHGLEGQRKSLRAVEPAKQTPFKMWEVSNGRMQPVVARCHPSGVPFHSSPTHTLPTVYIQNSSLEMSMTANVTELGNIHGRVVYPFFTEGLEGLSIDTEVDWARAESMAALHPELLPDVTAHV